MISYLNYLILSYEIWYEILLGEIFFHYLFMHSALLCRGLCKIGLVVMVVSVLLQAIDIGHCNEGVIFLPLCLPQDRVHAGMSGFPCPGWSRSKLAGWTSRSRKSPTPQRTIFGPGQKVTSLNIALTSSYINSSLSFLTFFGLSLKKKNS